MIELFWVLFAVSLSTIIISLMMSPDSNSFSGALVGSSDLDLFKQSKEQGSKKVLKWSMTICGVLIMILALVVRALM